MNVISIILLILWIFYTILLSVYFYNTFFKLIPHLENKLEKVYDEFRIALEALKEVDIKGTFNSAFENDDEVSIVFNQIKKIISDLDSFMEEMDEKNENIPTEKK